jgi:hypothetical protein
MRSRSGRPLRATDCRPCVHWWTRAVDGCQDRDGVLGEPLVGGREAHPSSFGFDQLRSGFLCASGAVGSQTSWRQ